MIRAEKRGLNKEPCNCCQKQAELDVVHGFGKWPGQTNTIRLCRECTNDLVDDIFNIIGDDPSSVICDEEPEKVICEEKQIEEDEGAAPSSEILKEIECKEDS